MIAESPAAVLNEEERAHWAALHRVPYIGPARFARLREQFGAIQAAWRAPQSELSAALDQRAVESLLRTRASLDPIAEHERVSRLGISVVTVADREYPRLLAQIPAPPPVLYVKGALLPEDDAALAIVGTRRSTSYGREVAARFAADFAEAGLTVVSGLARGVDAAAHEASLRAGGRTIAVLGSGVDIVYPPEHKNLAAQIVEHGALVSDYPPGRKPDAPNFPARNRIISGLSLGVVVVEAPARSGTLITVDFAADQGREVFVVPGSVLSANSAGGHRLLRDGARLVTCGADVMDDLRIGERKEQAAVQQALPLTDQERRLLNHIGADPMHLDELLIAAGLSVAEGSGLVTMLELKGLVRDVGARHFVRV
jgi:DNA processing protein